MIVFFRFTEYRLVGYVIVHIQKMKYDKLVDNDEISPKRKLPKLRDGSNANAVRV